MEEVSAVRMRLFHAMSEPWCREHVEEIDAAIKRALTSVEDDRGIATPSSDRPQKHQRVRVATKRGTEIGTVVWVGDRHLGWYANVDLDSGYRVGFSNAEEVPWEVIGE